MRNRAARRLTKAFIRLNDARIKELLATLDARRDALVVHVFGTSAVSPSTLARLRKRGMLPSVVTAYPDHAFLFGLLADQLDAADAERMSYAAFRARFPQPAPKSATLTTLRRGLRQRLTDLFDTGRRGVKRALSTAETSYDLEMALKRVTGDAERNWKLVVATELHNAFQCGRAEAIKRRNGGRDPRVFKRPRPDACVACFSMYLHAGSSVPRVFRLSKLAANGSNVGRSRDQRRPVVGATHPGCRCELQELPAGFGLDVTGRMVLSRGSSR